MWKLSLAIRSCSSYLHCGLAIGVAIWASFLLSYDLAGQSLQTLSDRYDSQYEKEDYQAAEATARQGVAIADRGRDVETQIAWLDGLGDALLEQDGKELEATKYYQRSLELEKKLRGPKHENVAYRPVQQDCQWIPAGGFRSISLCKGTFPCVRLSQIMAHLSLAHGETFPTHDGVLLS